jgi:hypothetical protein
MKILCFPSQSPCFPLISLPRKAGRIAKNRRKSAALPSLDFPSFYYYAAVRVMFSLYVF